MTKGKRQKNRQHNGQRKKTEEQTTHNGQRKNTEGQTTQWPKEKDRRTDNTMTKGKRLKDRQHNDQRKKTEEQTTHNGQRKKDKKTNNDLQNIHINNFYRALEAKRLESQIMLMSLRGRNQKD